MKRSVLVLGAGGFIGQHVVAALAATDWALPIAGVRRRTGAGTGGCEQRLVDATNGDSVRTAMQGVTDVVNCVAGNEHSLVASAESVAAAAGEFAAAGSPPRVIHLSTMSVYGSAEGVLDESAPLRADLGPYSEAKVAAENAARRYPHTVILRPGCVFGPDSAQWSVRMARLLLAHRLGDLGTDGDGYCNLVHVDDVAQAILGALQTPASDGHAFNLSAPSPPTWNEFLIGYAMALHAVPVRRLPGWQLRLETKLLAPALKIAEIAGRRVKLGAARLPPPIPPSLIRLMRQRIQLDSKAAQTQLGVRWKETSASLQETARWYLDGQASSRARKPAGVS
jgi:2-alkyl-3-oxoalkanoate reductase